MLVTVRHVLIACIGSVTAAAVAVLVLSLIRNDFDIDQVLGDWLLVLAAPTLAGLAAGVSLGVIAWRSQHGVRTLTRQLTAVRHNPSRANINAVAFDESLGPLVGEFEALSTCYRQALADRVKQRAVLETLRGQLRENERGNLRPGVQRTAGTSRHMVARLTPNLHWINATPALQRFLGCTMQELSGRAFAEMVPAQQVAALTRVFEECLSSGEAHNTTVRFLSRRHRPADQSSPARVLIEPRYVQMDVLTRYDDDGQPLHFRCYFEDVTAHIRAEKKLRRRTAELEQANQDLLRINHDLQRLKESYRDLYHNAPIMFFTLDAEGRFVACNDTMVQALGYRRDELHELPFDQLLPPDAAAAWKHSLHPDGTKPHALMVDGEVEMQWVKADGTIIDVWIRSIPLAEVDGKLVRSRSAAQDVTQRNRLANELRRRGDELEQAYAELLTINKELDDFTSVVAHDLKEPLRTLEAYSNLLAEEYSTRLGADGFECINYMLTASRRLSKLIDAVLTLSRAGKIATAPRVFHLNEAVAIVRRDLGDMLLRRNATLNVEGLLPTLVGDLERVTQLLTNLVANGLKYNTQPQPAVVIGEADRSDRAGYVTLFVRDNGIGIDPRFHKEIFHMFRRLDRKDEYEGHGAGLAICKKIVQAHTGKIWVESAPGQGSTFFFTLPRSPKAAAALLPVPDTAQANGQAVPLDPLPARLLLVEDMPEMGLIVQRFAKKAGHELHWVKTAEEAWEHLQEHQPDLVLLDIHLPGMDGIELCRRLRTLTQQAKLPIALFSQAAGAEDIRTGLSAGANYVLSKELLCQPEAWRQRLAEILHSSRSQGPGVSRQQAAGTAQESEVS
jgi:PAS domain S-box-containing protein